ncbi:MAG: tetratricopeptide repeat protein, partial [Myxococcota bacterium]
EMGDLLQQALHLYGLNNVHWTVGRFEACHDNCTRSLYIARRIGHRQLEWTALYGLGFAQWALRRFHEALATLQHAMRLARE